MVGRLLEHNSERSLLRLRRFPRRERGSVYALAETSTRPICDQIAGPSCVVTSLDDTTHQSRKEKYLGHHAPLRRIGGHTILVRAQCIGRDVKQSFPVEEGRKKDGLHPGKARDRTSASRMRATVARNSYYSPLLYQRREPA